MKWLEQLRAEGSLGDMLPLLFFLVYGISQLFLRSGKKTKTPAQSTGDGSSRKSSSTPQTLDDFLERMSQMGSTEDNEPEEAPPPVSQQRPQPAHSSANRRHVSERSVETVAPVIRGDTKAFDQFRKKKNRRLDAIKRHRKTANISVELEGSQHDIPDERSSQLFKQKYMSMPLMIIPVDPTFSTKGVHARPRLKGHRQLKRALSQAFILDRPLSQNQPPSSAPFGLRDI